jgi:hypothetical protein
VPHCSFYGAEADFECILEFVFAELDCRVIEASSDTDTPIVEFSSLPEVTSHVDRDLFEKYGGYARLILCPKPLSPSSPSGARNGTRAYQLATIVSPRRDGASYRLILGE